MAAVNCRYFLSDPLVGIHEADEILQPGGIFLASTPSRYHDPEIAGVAEHWGEPGTFDAEEAADLVARTFDEMEVDWWEAPAYHLPDRDAVVDYLVAFGIGDPDVRAPNSQCHWTSPRRASTSGRQGRPWLLALPSK